MIPSDAAIDTVMQQTGMGRMQAINHLRSRAMLRDDRGRWVEQRRFETIQSYWRNPGPFEAEEAAHRAQANAAIDAAVRANHPYVGDGK